MSILFVGSRASDFSGSTFKETNSAYFDSLYSTECAAVLALFNGGSNGFTLNHEVAASDTTWYHFYVRTGTKLTNTSNDGYWFTLYNSVGSAVARCDVLDGNLRSQVFGDTTVQGASFTIAESTKLIIDVKIIVGANITMEIYVNGILQSTATAANTGAITAPVNLTFEHEDMAYISSGSLWYYSEMVITDNESTLNWRIATLVPAAQGTYDQWNGTFADVVSLNDGLSINTAVANQKESWTLTAYNGPATTSGVRSILNTYNANVGIAGPTQLTPFIRHAATDVDGTTIAPDGLTFEDLTVNPQTGLPWDTADFGALEIGVKSTA